MRSYEVGQLSMDVIGMSNFSKLLVGIRDYGVVRGTIQFVDRIRFKHPKMRNWITFRWAVIALLPM